MIRKFLSFIIVILVIAAVFGALWAWQQIYVARTPGSVQQINFLIEKGQGTKEVAKNLEKQGIIKNGFIFQAYVFIRGEAKKLQAGEYELSPSMNIPQVVDKIAAGEVRKERITIIEGWTLKDIGQYLEAQGVASADDFFELAGYPARIYSPGSSLPGLKDFGDEFSFLKEKPSKVGLEGYIFPDTYEIIPGTSLENIIRKTLSNFDRKITSEIRQEAVSQEKSLFEIITMASLIEREVRSLEDKKIVSGILWKRLGISMPLQVDATIYYIAGKTGADISGQDFNIDSPYNTYKYAGLPAGPICNPGLESIIAAAYPESSPYFYYLSTPAGETIFSKTLQEHNIAREKYLR